MDTDGEFNRFVKLAARALYRDLPAGSAGKTVDVLDALTSQQWVREKALSKELKMDRKQLDCILKFLKEEKLIRRENPTTSKRQKRRCNVVAAYGQEPLVHSDLYCCLEYAQVYDMVKSQIHTMTENLKSDLSHETTVQEYMCSVCDIKYSAFDAQYLVSATDDYFHCERCNGNLLPMDSEIRKKDSLEKMQTMKEDLKPLSLSIKKLMSVDAPEIISLQEWLSITDRNDNVVIATKDSFIEATDFRSSTIVASSEHGNKDSEDMSSFLNTLQSLKRLKELPSWIIRDEGANVSEKQRKMINDFVLDVEATDKEKQEICSNTSCDAVRKRQEEDPNVGMQDTRVGMKRKQHDDVV